MILFFPSHLITIRLIKSGIINGVMDGGLNFFSAQGKGQDSAKDLRLELTIYFD